MECGEKEGGKGCTDFMPGCMQLAKNKQANKEANQRWPTTTGPVDSKIQLGEIVYIDN